MLLAFICSEFSLSHYLPKVRFSDTAAACLALHPGNYSPGFLSQHKISCLWRQGRHGDQNPCAWTPAHSSSPLLQFCGIKSCVALPITSQAPSHCDIRIKLQSQTHRRVMPSLILDWGKLLYHRAHTLSPILKSPCSASVNSRKPQRYTILVLKSIVFSPSIIPAGLPAPLTGCYEQLSKERMFQAQAPGA